MTKNERDLNSYALRDALLLTVYGLYGLILLPLLYYHLFMKHLSGVMEVLLLLAVGIRSLSYIWIGFSGMIRASRINPNHQILNFLFFIFFVVNLFIGIYISTTDGLQTPALTALSLSSLLIAAVMVYYFTLFQLKESSHIALRKLISSLLFFSGGGEIFFHQFPYVNTIMGWFMIWMSLNGPRRPLFWSFVYSIVGSLVFYLPRFMLPTLKDFLIENEIAPISLIYVSFGVILAIIALLLKFKTNEITSESENRGAINNTELASRK